MYMYLFSYTQTCYVLITFDTHAHTVYVISLLSLFSFICISFSHVDAVEWLVAQGHDRIETQAEVTRLCIL